MDFMSNWYMPMRSLLEKVSASYTDTVMTASSISSRSSLFRLKNMTWSNTQLVIFFFTAVCCSWSMTCDTDISKQHSRSAQQVSITGQHTEHVSTGQHRHQARHGGHHAPWRKRRGLRTRWGPRA